MTIQASRRRVGAALAAAALVALTTGANGCPGGEDENPYAKECRWMAGDADECWDLASSQGCVGRQYDPGSLACLGKECLDCDVTGALCPQRCEERGLGSRGYRETSRQKCLDRIMDLVDKGTPAGGGYLGDVQCCCLPG